VTNPNPSRAESTLLDALQQEAFSYFEDKT
jgi:hypothetical protein